MSLFTDLKAAVSAYAANPDPLAATANAVALLVASNQPFYPLYLYWLVDGSIAPVWFTFLSTPFFLAIPVVARRNALAGRAMLPLTGIANSVLSAKMFGTGSGVEVFLIPCVLLALLLFRPAERMTGLVIAALGFAAFLFLHGRYGAPLVVYDAADNLAMIRLNATSAAALTAFIGILFSNLLAEAERSTKPAGGEKSG